MSEIWKSICSEVSYTIIGRVESVLFVLVIAPPLKRWGSVFIRPRKIESPPKRAGVEDGEKPYNPLNHVSSALVTLNGAIDPRKSPHP